MKYHWKRAMAAFLVLALVAALCLGCAKEKEEGVTITIGHITDLTGVSAPNVVPLYYAIQDAAAYYNEEGLIPGAKIKVVPYDMKTDFARDIPGYEWVKERGAKVIITVLMESTEADKPFAEKDNIPLAALGTSVKLLQPPGWAFFFNCPSAYEMKTLLDWISEEHWDYDQGIPKIGMVGWKASYQVECEEATEEYCQAHSDQFQWVGGYLAPLGVMTWAGEVEAVKNCDYIVGDSLGPSNGTFINEFQTKGYTATLIGASAIASCRGFLVDMCGWEALDGTLTTSVCPWWNETSPIVDLARTLLDRYRSKEAEVMIHAGSGYLGGFHNACAILDIVRKAVEEVGAGNFDGQAFYNAALEFKVDWEGYPEWSFSEIKRYLVDQVRVYEWSAKAAELVGVSGWLPVVTE